MNRKRIVYLLIILTVFNTANVLYSEYVWAVGIKGRSTIIEAIGFSGLSASSDCTVTRNPALESISDCMGDMPAGYCYHLSCSIVGSPDSSPLNQMSCGR